MDKALLRRGAYAVAALIIVALVIGLYKAKTDAARTEAHVRQLQHQIDESEADLRALRAEIAQLESPARIEALAEDHLGVTVGSEGQALPESALKQRLPPPRAPRPAE
jgi:cell division protein FtsL